MTRRLTVLFKLCWPEPEATVHLGSCLFNTTMAEPFVMWDQSLGRVSPITWSVDAMMNDMLVVYRCCLD